MTVNDNLRELELLLSADYSIKLEHLNVKKSCYTHKTHLLKHQKKFDALLTENDTPFLSPYSSLLTFVIPKPTFHGPLPSTKPITKNNSTKTVINLSDQPISAAETSVLSLGLKFVPTPTSDPAQDVAPLIQSVTKKLGDGLDERCDV